MSLMLQMRTSGHFNICSRSTCYVRRRCVRRCTGNLWGELLHYFVDYCLDFSLSRKRSRYSVFIYVDENKFILSITCLGKTVKNVQLCFYDE